MKQFKNLSFLIPLILCVVPLIASQKRSVNEASNQLNQINQQKAPQKDQLSRQDVQMNKGNLIQETYNQQQQQQQLFPQGLLQNPMNGRFPGIVKNMVGPFRRFLFPGLQEDSNQQFRLPSPVWLATATANQILPLLRAADDQFSPWIQSLATMTKPDYIPDTPTEGQQVKSQSSQRPKQFGFGFPLLSQQQNNGPLGNRLFPFPLLG